MLSLGRRHRAHARWWALLVLAFVCGAAPSRAVAQLLLPKRLLTIGAAPGCDIASQNQVPIARRDNAEARRLAAVGQEAALVGDQTAAREAYARAAVLNPTDERVAYDLARAHDELADTTKAIAEYCRYLVLSPSGRESGDVRSRLTGLVAPAVQTRANDVQVAFRLGLALFDDARYDASARAFADVIRLAPESAEGFFNLGLAHAATGQRADAMRDLEQYRAAAPTVDDRVEVARAIETLRRPVFSAGAALARGVVPGFGQFYTSRSGRGVAVLVASAASAGFAFVQQTTKQQIAYVDPNGVPAPYTETTKERPYFVAGLSAAVALTLAGATEAVWFAKRSQRGASIVARPAASKAPSSDTGMTFAPLLDRQGKVGIRASLVF